jgi:hypothetical protein
MVTSLKMYPKTTPIAKMSAIIEKSSGEIVELYG